MIDTPAVRRSPIVDCGEPLVPTSLVPERLLTHPVYHLEGLTGALPECFVRDTVLDRLLDASRTLPAGHRLVIFDSWRALGVQHLLFDRGCEIFECRHGDDGREQVEAFISRPMADVSASPPYHLTGGALDLSIVNAAGRLLDMGTDFDALEPGSATDFFEHSGQAGAAGFEAGRIARIRDNRRLLYHAMGDAGFVNLPSEWWHYDYGDQLWAWRLGQPHAIYGMTAPDFRWGRLPE